METDSCTKEKECSSGKYCACGKKVTIGVLTPVGILLAVAAAFFPKIYIDSVKKQLVLVKGSEAYDNWFEPPSPVYMTYYLFNYTNVAEMVHNTENPVKPNVSQIGPFVYREVRRNAILDYNEHNITYLQNYSYVFDASRSCSTCRVNSKVYIPRIAIYTILKQISTMFKEGSEGKRMAVRLFFRFAEGTLFRQVTVHEAIWGYEDPILKMMEGDFVKSLLKQIGIPVPDLPIVALQHNGTEGAEMVGNVTLLTGKDDINDVQRIVRWRGEDTLPYWLTKYGNMINGTDGTRTPPFLSRDYKWYVFITQLCRSLYFTYQKDVTYRGIKLYRFTTTARLFLNASVNPDNRAFCTKNGKNKTDTCWGSGLLCISECQDGGPPIFMSAPHFYNGDPKFAERINGLHPNATLHSSIADVEPTTGITMRAYKRLQINVLGQRTWIGLSKSLQHENNFLPILSLEEGADIDAETAAMFKRKVMLPKAVLVTYGQYVVMAIGIFIIAVAITLVLMLVSNSYKGRYNSDDISVKRMDSTEDPVRAADNDAIRKIDSCVTIIENEYVSGKTRAN